MAFLLNLRERRKLGVTQRSVRRILMGMKAEGEFAGRALDELLEDVPSIALSVVAVCKSENPKAFCNAEAAGIDWDKFGDFIERLITLLLPLIVKV